MHGYSIARSVMSVILNEIFFKLLTDFALYLYRGFSQVSESLNQVTKV